MKWVNDTTLNGPMHGLVFTNGCNQFMYVVSLIRVEQLVPVLHVQLKRAQTPQIINFILPDTLITFLTSLSTLSMRHSQ